MHLALHPGSAERLALLCAPIDFHASGRLARWAKPETFPLDAAIDGFGNFPAPLLRASFAWLRPVGQWSKWRSLAERLDQPGFGELWAAMERWSRDAVDFPGEAYREYVRRCYFDNALIEGGWSLGGRPVDLAEGTAPATVFTATGDHICPAEAAEGLSRVWGAAVDTVSIQGGHVGVCVGRALPEALVEWATR